MINTQGIFQIDNKKVTTVDSVQVEWKRQIDKVTTTNNNSKPSFAQVTGKDIHVVPETEPIKIKIKKLC